MYPVQVILDEGNLVIRLAEIIEWFDERQLGAGKFQYSMAAGHVDLRIDFDFRSEARAFVKAFGGSMIGGLAQAAD
jgi:hypothetical protein